MFESEQPATNSSLATVALVARIVPAILIGATWYPTRNPAGGVGRMKTTVPAIVGLIVLSLCSWRVHQDAVDRLKKPDSVEITVYGPDGEIIRPIYHR